MKCWQCRSPLIWGGDQDCDDDEEFLIVSNFSCSNCKAFVLFYTPREIDD